jgi:soluble lytic murein transglycosylase-like protein
VRRLRPSVSICALALLLVTACPISADDTVEDRADHAQLRQFLSTTISDAGSFTDRFDAEVWLVDMSRRLTPYVADPQERLDLLRQIHHYAIDAGLPPEVVLAVIEVESHFDRFAVSRVGAQGLMQVMPFWREEIGRSSDNLTQIATNLNYGCRILQFYLQKSDGHLLNALKRYNGASNLKYSRKVQTAWQENWSTENLSWR